MVWSGIQQDDILFYLGVVDELNDVLFWNAFIAVQGLLVLAQYKSVFLHILLDA
jgi:hypothetical protein